MNKTQFITHPIPPFFNADSEILVLGSFPSVKSREEGFFYGNPKNRFWTVLAEVYGESAPKTVEEKKAFLSRNKIALYDVVYSCEIAGSSDASIKNVKAADIGKILSWSKIGRIFLNGMTAEKLYDKYIYSKTGVKATVLPSTSPANAAYSKEKLTAAWSVLKK